MALIRQSVSIGTILERVYRLAQRYAYQNIRVSNVGIGKRGYSLTRVRVSDTGEVYNIEVSVV